MTEALHIVCPHCHTTNRVKAADMASAPDCGSCHQPLFTGAPLALDEAGFDRHIGRSQIPVLVDFWAPWCAPCRALGPILDKLAAEMAGRFVLAKLDTDRHPDIAGRYGIRGIPDVRLFVDGAIVDGFTGALPERELRAFLDRALPSPVAPLVARARALREAGDAAGALALLTEARGVAAGDEVTLRAGEAAALLLLLTAEAIRVTPVA